MRNYYSPENAFDASEATSWVEGAPGDGIGEYIEVHLSSPILLSSLFLLNGFGDKSYWQENNRIKELRIVALSQDGAELGSRTLTLTDSPARQEVRPGVSVMAADFRFEIRSVYQGSKWRDTAVADISLPLVRPIPPGQDRSQDVPLPPRSIRPVGQVSESLANLLYAATRNSPNFRFRCALGTCTEEVNFKIEYASGRWLLAETKTGTTTLTSVIGMTNKIEIRGRHEGSYHSATFVCTLVESFLMKVVAADADPSGVAPSPDMPCNLSWGPMRTHHH